ncbi:MAG TPA: DUF3052 family protein [Bacteroidia bacterium]|jgi:hypothetical protein|nr:DUF3052 family protein [Bacteroidia bacterium]
MTQAGYSGTPLAKKLGIKENCRMRLIGEPENYFDLFDDLPSEIKILDDLDTKKDIIHYFTKHAGELNDNMKLLRNEIKEDGAIWISWPKKTSKIETDVDEHVVRTLALRNGLVDVKVCAIDDVWSGLKLVIRLKDRKK